MEGFQAAHRCRQRGPAWSARAPVSGAGRGLLLERIWKRLPGELQPRRLVLTAPIDSYRRYRQWLQQATADLPVEEIALVDEPTAAAIGAGLPPAAACWWLTWGGHDRSVAGGPGGGGQGGTDRAAVALRRPAPR
ncbi:hypothetical protein [Cyanobium sp. ATX-6F1]|uniref:hypothetical protein n=1 Tax=Cyanobium sp. ATX-6F1 TaxID=3137388 RepID=UPI0039BDBA7C